MWNLTLISISLCFNVSFSISYCTTLPSVISFHQCQLFCFPILEKKIHTLPTSLHSINIYRACCWVLTYKDKPSYGGCSLVWGQGATTE